MAKPFYELRERLLRAGVAPRHVRRYLAELTDHLADLRAEEERAGRSRADAEAAALVRLGSMEDLARAMIGKRQLQSWSARAPWAMFGLAPVSLLAGAWFVALFILWSGWQIFMPGTDTPFGTRLAGPVYGFENIYFQVGRMIYFGAPFVIGWASALSPPVSGCRRFGPLSAWCCWRASPARPRFKQAVPRAQAARRMWAWALGLSIKAFPTASFMFW